MVPRLSSGSADEPVATRPDALEVGTHSTGAARKAAVDRIARDAISEEPFDGDMRVPHIHRAISVPHDPDDGSLDHAVAGTSLRHRSIVATPVRKTRRKRVENARKRWRMV